VLPDLVQKIKDLDEREEFEPRLRSILADGTQTPHGPAEIVDILTPVLMFQYDHARRLGRPVTKKELDRTCVIGSYIYATCFGSWKVFEEIMASETV